MKNFVRPIHSHLFFWREMENIFVLLYPSLPKSGLLSKKAFTVQKYFFTTTKRTALLETFSNCVRMCAKLTKKRGHSKIHGSKSIDTKRSVGKQKHSAGQKDKKNLELPPALVRFWKCASLISKSFEVNINGKFLPRIKPNLVALPPCPAALSRSGLHGLLQVGAIQNSPAEFCAAVAKTSASTEENFTRF